MSTLLRKSLSILIAVSVTIVALPQQVFAAQEVRSDPPEAYEETNEIEAAVSSSCIYELLESGDIELEGEDCSLREETSKQFRLSTGHMLAAAYPYDVHYEDDGELKDIDNSLYEDKDAGVLRNTASSLSISLPATMKEDSPVVLESRGYTLSFLLEGTEYSEAQVTEDDSEPKDIPYYRSLIEAPLKTSTVIYPDVLSGTDARYELYGKTLKEELIISSPGAVRCSYSFYICAEGLDAEFAEDGGVTFRDKNGEYIFGIPSPCLYEEESGEKGPVYAELERISGSEYRLTYIPDPVWMSSEEREFPVILDPTVTSTKSLSNRSATMACSGKPNEDYSSATNLFIGKRSDGSQGICRSYIKINTLPSIKSSDSIVSARLSYHASTDDDCEDEYIKAYMIDEDNVLDYSLINWNNMPFAEDRILDLRFPNDDLNYQSLNITKAVMRWYEGTAVNNGVMLQFSNETTNSRYARLSTYHQNYTYITIVYTNSNGLEGHWDYTSLPCGRAGTVHVQDFSGNLTLDRTDFPYLDTFAYPVTFYFNHCTANENCGYGNGFRSIYNQTVKEQTIGSDTYYCLTDGDGTQIFFKDGEEYDEQGLGYRRNNTSSLPTIITDRNDSKYYFDHSTGRIKKISIPLGRINGSYRYRNTYISYVTTSASDLRIATIYDDAGRTYSFNYDVGTNKLTSIEYLGTGSTALSTVSYTYSGVRLSKVTYPDNEDVRYTWSSGRLTVVKDILRTDNSRDQISISYSGGSSYRPPNAASLEYKSQGITMSSLSFEYGDQTTKVTDQNSHFLQYQFNADGNTTGVVNDRGQAVYGRYERDSDITASPHRLTASSRLKGSAGAVSVTLNDGSGTETVDLYSKENLILNPDFTSSISGQWVNANSGSVSFSRVSESGLRGGLDNWALKLNGSANKIYGVKQVIQISDGAVGDILSFGGWLKAAGIPLGTFERVRKAGIEIRFCNNTVIKQTEYIPMNMGCEDWQYIGRQISAKYAYNKIEVRLIYNYETEYILLDGPCLTREPVEYVYTYTSTRQVSSVTDPEGNKTRYEYTDGKLKTIRYPDGSRLYNTITDGLITKTKSAENIYTYYTYDNYGNITKTSTHPSASGSAELFSSSSYEADGSMPVSVTTADGNTAAYTNDTERLLVSSMTDPSNVTASFSYDVMGRQVSSVKQGASVLSTYSDDVLTSLSHTNTSSANTVYTFTYGPGGLPVSTLVGSRTLSTKLYNTGTWTLSSETYGNGDYVKYSYDDSEVLESSFTNHTQSAGKGYGYYYNAEGELCRVVSSDVTISNGEVALGTPKSSVNYLYSSNGSLTRLIRADILPNSASELLVLDASLSYNENSELTGLTEKIRKGNTGREFTYTYSYDHDGRPLSASYGNVSEVRVYDSYGRQTSETVTKGQTQIFSRSYSYRDISSSRTTPQVETLSTSFGNYTRAHNYTYDVNGRITSDITTSTSYVYEYDSLGQLIWEKSASKGKAWQYTYDLGGNILSKTEYDYSNDTVGSQTGQKLYVYGDSGWKDLLTSYDGQSITYDVIGNPLSYRGWTMDWQAGRQLASMSRNSSSLSFEYDESGLRTKKTAGTNEIRYIWNGDRLIAQLGADADFYFHYDAAGEMTGYTYVPASGSETECFLIKNLQGDVERIVNGSGTLVANYTYDAWGNVLTSSGTFKDINPIRYRGYYFDKETGLYYLKSRYYDPEVGRFINADAQFDGNAGTAGYSLFTYAANDPVMYKDDDGTSITVAIIVGAAIGGVLGGIAGNAYANSREYTGWKKAGCIASGVILGGAISAIGTYYIASEVVSVAKIGFISEVSTLLGNMPELSGSTRDRLLSAVQDRKLYSIIDQLYRPGASIGDGGTAAALVNEFCSGESLHLLKASERLMQLNRLISSGSLGLNDLDIAQALRDDLQYAVNLFNIY